MSDISKKKLKVKIAFNSPAVLVFAGLCLVVMILNEITRGGSNALVFSVQRAPLSNPVTWLRLFTHVLGHASWDHLLGNMMFVLLLGPMLEEKYGTLDLVVVILVTALLTGLAHFLLFPGARLLGASGVVFAMILLSSITRVQEHTIPVTLILVALIYIGQQVWLSIAEHSNVSYLTHILGGAIGAGMGFWLNGAAKRRRSA